MIAHDVIRRPGLAYQLAFDWLAVRLHAASGPVAYAASAAWQLVEMADRLPGVPALGATATARTAVAAALGLPDIPAFDTGQLWAVGLIEPAEAPREIFDRLESGGRLYVVAGGALGRFLAERRVDNDFSPLSGRAIAATARASGFRVVERLGVQPPAAVLHHYAGELVRAAGRRDVRDRRHAAMRRAMLTDGRAASVSALVCLTMERAG
jgi:hypothetical protein